MKLTDKEKKLLDNNLKNNQQNAKCEQGICPCCHKFTLDYGMADFVDSMVVYPWKCTNCDHEGEEWYELNFVGHNIILFDGEELKLEN